MKGLFLTFKQRNVAHHGVVYILDINYSYWRKRQQKC